MSGSGFLAILTLHLAIWRAGNTTNEA